MSVQEPQSMGARVRAWCNTWKDTAIFVTAVMAIVSVVVSGYLSRNQWAQTRRQNSVRLLYDLENQYDQQLLQARAQTAAAYAELIPALKRTVTKAA